MAEEDNTARDIEDERKKDEAASLLSPERPDLLEIARDPERDIAAPAKAKEPERGADASDKDFRRDQSASAERTQSVKTAPPPLEDPYPDEINRNYYRKRDFAGDDHIYADAKGSRELFQVSGDKLKTKNEDPHAVKLMLDTAAHRGWTEIKVKGTEEFRREAWLEGQARGINVTGYKPNELDLQELKKREQMFLRNEIAPDLQRQSEGPSAAAAGASDDKTIPEDEAFDRSRAERSNPSYKTGIEGTVIEQGSRPYRDDAENDHSPYVVLRDSNGREHTAWGVGLPDAMLSAGAKVGDQIRLQEAGMETVMKSVIRTVDGQKIRMQQEVERRKWDAEVTQEREQTSQVIDDRENVEAPLGAAREDRINAAEANVTRTIVAGENALHTGPARDAALEDGRFANEARAKEYAATGRGAGDNPQLRSAVAMEAYVERKLRAKFHNDPVAVQRGLSTARNKISQAISRGQDFPKPRVVETRELSRNDERGRESIGADAEKSGKQTEQREQIQEQNRDMERDATRQNIREQNRDR
ncbi:LPD7 domain-containing protein [Agrobacterium pusense]|uniref:Large polyvalent protein-associated domain-containing protein n=1 Tax=Agrobacterium pusense TaxID=648995 RepID=A0AA44EG23_9HYPH|nr:LPD7 domain-containing protein [Agrobacterium pusense]NRF07769.1 hypothetical protein [Agrobacterium pusense]NRF18066.1 hypothetical protein [Agrobacterium pusense]PZU78340.1 MAG: hypothetical protein DI546_03515 [Rhizobium sp.]